MEDLALEAIERVARSRLEFARDLYFGNRPCVLKNPTMIEPTPSSRSANSDICAPSVGKSKRNSSIAPTWLRTVSYTIISSSTSLVRMNDAFSAKTQQDSPKNCTSLTNATFLNAIVRIKPLVSFRKRKLC